MIWLIIALSMGSGVLIGITAYHAANPIELPRARPCEPQLDDRQDPVTDQEIT